MHRKTESATRKRRHLRRRARRVARRGPGKHRPHAVRRRASRYHAIGRVKAFGHHYRHAHHRRSHSVMSHERMGKHRHHHHRHRRVVGPHFVMHHKKRELPKGLRVWRQVAQKHGYLLEGEKFRKVPEKGSPAYAKLKASFERAMHKRSGEAVRHKRRRSPRHSPPAARKYHLRPRKA